MFCNARTDVEYCRMEGGHKFLVQQINIYQSLGYTQCGHVV